MSAKADLRLFRWCNILMNYVASISPCGINAHGIWRICFRFDRIRPSMPATSVPYQPWTEIHLRWNRRGYNYQVIGR